MQLTARVPEVVCFAGSQQVTGAFFQLEEKSFSVCQVAERCLSIVGSLLVPRIFSSYSALSLLLQVLFLIKSHILQAHSRV